MDEFDAVNFPTEPLRLGKPGNEDVFTEEAYEQACAAARSHQPFVWNVSNNVFTWMARSYEAKLAGEGGPVHTLVKRLGPDTNPKWGVETKCAHVLEQASSSSSRRRNSSSRTSLPHAPSFSGRWGGPEC